MCNIEKLGYQATNSATCIAMCVQAFEDLVIVQNNVKDIILTALLLYIDISAKIGTRYKHEAIHAYTKQHNDHYATTLHCNSEVRLAPNYALHACH